MALHGEWDPGASASRQFLQTQRAGVSQIKNQARHDRLKAETRAEIEAKYADDIARETKRIEDAIAALDVEKKGSARVSRAASGVAPDASHEPNEGEAGRLARQAGGPHSPQDLAARRKALQKELADYRRAMAEKIAAESRAPLKQRFDYPVFLYEAEHVGITATGEPDTNELYPNDRQPPGCEKTCVELYREFRKNPDRFFVAGPAE